MNYRKKALVSDQISTFNFLIGQSHDVWRSYSLTLNVSKIAFLID